MDEIATESDYENRQKAIKASLKKIASKSDSKIAERISNQDDEGHKVLCMVLSKLFYEFKDEIEDASMKPMEALDDFYKAAKFAIEDNGKSKKNE